MGDRSFPFIVRLMTDPPLSLSLEQAKSYAPYIKDFWATVAAGDAWFDYDKLPEQVQKYFRQFNAIAEDGSKNFIDNNAVLTL